MSSSLSSVPRVIALVFLLFALAFTACGEDDPPANNNPEPPDLDQGTPDMVFPDMAFPDMAIPDMEIPPDCVTLNPLRLWKSDPSAVAMLFTAEDCFTGEAFSGFEQADFVIQEDGQNLSSEAVPRILPSKGLRVYVTLLLDMSGSTLPNLAQVQGGARRFVEEVLLTQALDNVYIGLDAFDGSATPITLERPTRDIERLLGQINSLGEFEGPDQGSTNLNGAVRQGVQNLQAYQQYIMEENLGGVVTTGYLVVFTDGGDTSQREDATDAKNAVESARTYDVTQGEQPTVQTLAVGLNGSDYDPAALGALVGESWVSSAERDELALTFERVGRQIGLRIRGTYLLAYCSASRAGNHTVTLSVANRDSNNTLDFSFDADGFAGGCTAQFFETACDERSCGGFNCGACDDETERCDGATSGRCVSACITLDRCEGEDDTDDEMAAVGELRCPGGLEGEYLLTFKADVQGSRNQVGLTLTTNADPDICYTGTVNSLTDDSEIGTVAYAVEIDGIFTTHIPDFAIREPNSLVNLSLIATHWTNEGQCGDLFVTLQAPPITSKYCCPTSDGGFAMVRKDSDKFTIQTSDTAATCTAIIPNESCVLEDFAGTYDFKFETASSAGNPTLVSLQLAPHPLTCLQGAWISKADGTTVVATVQEVLPIADDQLRINMRNFGIPPGTNAVLPNGGNADVVITSTFADSAEPKNMCGTLSVNLFEPFVLASAGRFAAEVGTEPAEPRCP